MLYSATDSHPVSVSLFPRFPYDSALLFFDSAELEYKWIVPFFLVHIFIRLSTRNSSHATHCNGAQLGGEHAKDSSKSTLVTGRQHEDTAWERCAVRPSMPGLLKL